MARQHPTLRERNVVEFIFIVFTYLFFTKGRRAELNRGLPFRAPLHYQVCNFNRLVIGMYGVIKCYDPSPFLKSQG